MTRYAFPVHVRCGAPRDRNGDDRSRRSDHRDRPNERSAPWEVSEPAGIDVVGRGAATSGVGRRRLVRRRGGRGGSASSASPDRGKTLTLRAILPPAPAGRYGSPGGENPLRRRSTSCVRPPRELRRVRGPLDRDGSSRSRTAALDPRDGASAAQNRRGAPEAQARARSRARRGAGARDRPDGTLAGRIAAPAPPAVQAYPHELFGAGCRPRRVNDRDGARIGSAPRPLRRADERALDVTIQGPRCCAWPSADSEGEGRGHEPRLRDARPRGRGGSCASGFARHVRRGGIVETGGPVADRLPAARRHPYTLGSAARP